ncbi:transcription factor TFIID complex subunit 8 C-term-domain-containing protein [Aspergillus avenaceus]|uniref:Transcription initiation factor TFIID subunit 8 n=1 Tax=Aspergillus avenaceus TaxID=36643 RepID=A0A5N6U3F7_ASPAV|nr:transcription factor TFIID complex subunit 8 C-term-domain-containing protein [Aspergillus avenaceus]
MLAAEPNIKRSSSSLPEQPAIADVKRIKRPYHHHHRLQVPVNPALPEPAINDDAYVGHLMNRSIGFALRESGFEVADPAALESFRVATEEYLLKFASYVRQSMLSSRRIQPVPHDFEHALKKHGVRVDDLLPHAKTLPKTESFSTLLPSPADEEDSFKILPSLGPQLSGEDDRARSAYIPKHFPEFPSKHTYRHTPVFTEREQDPRKIRERATEDGRHGEEALRKLARAAFKDNQSGSSGRDKRTWVGKRETMDSMFEKTLKGLAKKMQKETTVPGPTAPMEIDFGAVDPEAKPLRNKVSLSIELPPIINCERELWRRTTTGSRRPEDRSSGTNQAPGVSRVDSWVST